MKNRTIIIVALIFLVVQICLPLVSTFGYDNPELPNVPTPEVITTITFDNNTANVNISAWWDDKDSHNATQMETSNTLLNIRESWFITLWNVIFGTKDTDDLTEGSTNLYDNRTWNETHADNLYAPNTTAGIQSLINKTGIYSTFNATYDAYPQTLNGTPNSIAWNRTGTDVFLNHIGDNVGIGTTTPTHKLNVVGNINITGNLTLKFGDFISELNPDGADAIRIKGTSSDVDVVIGHTTGYFSVWNVADNNIFNVDDRGDVIIAGDLTVDTDTFFVDSGANRVGIGTIIPGNELHVLDDDGTTIIKSENTGANSIAGFVMKNDVQTYAIRVEGNDNDNFQIRDVTNTKSRLVIDTSGNIGIGTATPNARLEIKGNASNGLSLNVSGDLYVNGSSGNVGIGTASPNQILEIAEEQIGGTARPTLRITDTNTTYGSSSDNIGIITGALEFYSNEASGNYPAVTAAIHAVSNSVTSVTHNLDFLTNSNAATPTVRMTITNLGDVGIGTASPVAKIHAASASTSANAVILASDSSGDGHGVGFFSGKSGGTPTSPVVLWSDGSDLRIGGGITDFSSGAGFEEYMRIMDSSGWVGIGTTSPGAKLHVQDGSVILANDSDSAIVVSTGGNIEIFRTAVPFIDFKNAYSDDFDFRLQQQGASSFELRSSGTDNILFLNGSTGNVGIGEDAPDFPLEFTNDVGQKIGLYHGANMGFGIQTELIEFIVPASSSDFAFGYGASGSLTRVMTIEGTGNVGIGTTTPNYEFSVAGRIESARSAPMLILNETDTNHAWFIVADANALGVRNGTIGSSPFFRILSSGNVGIGVNNPEVGLQLGDATTVETFRIKSGGAGNAVLSADASTGTGNPFTQYLVAGGNNWVTGVDNADSDKYKISFHSSDLGTNERITILTGGNVGIGTITPQQELDVNGWIVAGTTTDGIGMGLLGAVGTILGSDTALDVYNDLHLRASAATGLYLKTDGNIGIGTTNPSDKLQVVGNITSSNVFIPQYIFSHTNRTHSLVTVNVWANLTFDQEDSDVKFGISHTYNDETNGTFTIMQDGVYEIDYDFDVEDTSPSASDIDVAGRLIYANGTEVIGSEFETDITKQGASTELSHDFLAIFQAGDIVVFQFVANDVDVVISTHGTFGDHPESASIVIKKIANL